MNSAILRAVLAIAIVCGIGIIANVFNGSQEPGQSRLADKGVGPLIAPPRAASKVGHAAEEQRLEEAVYRELRTRGYLPASSRGNEIMTKAAILAFEFDHNLALTAHPSSMLLKALIFRQPSTDGQRETVPKSDAAHQLIVEVQRALAHLGYGRATTTAELDPETRKAILNFERARGLQPSGRVSAPLIESLGPAFDSARVGSTENRQSTDAG